MPDLSASLDVTLARTAGAIVVPRDALQQRRRAHRRPRPARQRFRGSRGDGRCSQRARSDDRIGPRRRSRHRAQRVRHRGRSAVMARHAQVLHASAQRPRGTRRDRHRRGRRICRHTPELECPDLPTARVTRGEFVDTLEIRGEIKPLKSVVLSSPMQSGELQILKLAKSGTMVKPGDVVVQFDPSTLERTIQEKQSEVKQADAEIEQAQAQTRIAQEQNATALVKAGYDIERAKLDASEGRHGFAPRDRAGKARRGGRPAAASASCRRRSSPIRPSAEADVSAKRHKREKALFDLRRAEQGLRNLELRAPVGRDGQRPAELPIGFDVRWPAGLPDRRSRVAGCGDPRAARSVVGAPRGTAGRIGSRTAAAATGGHRPDRSDSRDGIQGQPRQHLGAGARRLLVRLAAGEELRSEPGVSRRGHPDAARA